MSDIASNAIYSSTFPPSSPLPIVRAFVSSSTLELNSAEQQRMDASIRAGSLFQASILHRNHICVACFARLAVPLAISTGAVRCTTAADTAAAVLPARRHPPANPAVTLLRARVGRDAGGGAAAAMSDN